MFNPASGFALVALVGCAMLGGSLASPSPINGHELLPENYANMGAYYGANDGQQQAFASNPLPNSKMDSESDSEDEDDDEDVANAQAQLAALGYPINQPQQLQAATTSQLHDEASGQYQQVAARPSSDLKTAASHHKHHGHGAKGWLDMGAWTGKKGAFGWHDKHPVGKKGRK